MRPQIAEPQNITQYKAMISPESCQYKFMVLYVSRELHNTMETNMPRNGEHLTQQERMRNRRTNMTDRNIQKLQILAAFHNVPGYRVINQLVAKEYDRYVKLGKVPAETSIDFPSL